MNSIVFSVIIVSYKNLDVLKDCLDSLKKYNDIGKKLEIIIVDNSPENNIYEYIGVNYPDVVIVKNINNGFGAGNNKGAEMSKGKYLLFLNPDTLLIEPIFKFAINKFEKNLKLGLFGVKLIDNNFKRNMSFYLMDSTGLIASQINKIINYLDLYLDGKMLISGANLFVRKETFYKSGMFDENIFMYLEEQDLIKRIQRIKMETNYFKHKRIIHLEGKTIEHNSDAIKRRWISKKYYCKKYNINIQKKAKEEIRYNIFKCIVYFIFNNRDAANACIENIKIIKTIVK